MPSRKRGLWGWERPEVNLCFPIPSLCGFKHLLVFLRFGCLFWKVGNIRFYPINLV